jgi:hypothetical protein
MAYLVHSNALSFLRFASTYNPDNSWLESDVPGNDMIFALPFVEETDLSFSVMITASTTSEQNLLCSSAVTPDLFQIFLLNGVQNSFAGDIQPLRRWPDATNIANNQFVERVRINTSTFMFTWRYPLNNIFVDGTGSTTSKGVQIGDCFQLGFAFINPFSPSGTLNVLARGISNVLVRTKPEYTSLLTYDSDADDFGFYYCKHRFFQNRFRLPMYPGKPAYQENNRVYVKSDGKRRITEATAYKKYPVRVDYAPEWFHDCMVAALNHKNKRLISNGFSYSIEKEGGYEVAWQGKDYPHGPASFEVFTDWTISRNTCEECPEPPTPGTYNKTFTFDGCTSYNIDLKNVILPICNGPMLYTVIYTDPFWVAAASVNNATRVLNIQMTGPHPTVAPTVVTVAQISVQTPEGFNTINIVGTYSGLDAC